MIKLPAFTNEPPLCRAFFRKAIATNRRFLGASATSAWKRCFELVFNILGSRFVQRAGDLLANDLTKSPAQPLRGRLDRDLGRTKFGAIVAKGNARGPSVNTVLSRSKSSPRPESRYSASDPADHPLDHRLGPRTVEEMLRRQAVHRLKPIPALGVRRVDRYNRAIPAPFLGISAVALPGQKETAVGSQEGPKPPLVRVGRTQDLRLQ